MICEASLDYAEMELVAEALDRDFQRDSCQNFFANFSTTTNTPLYKGKGSNADPDAHRFLSVVPAASEPIIKIPIRRLEAAFDAALLRVREQRGFIRGRGLPDAIAVVSVVWETAKRAEGLPDFYAIEVYVLDLCKAFPSLRRITVQRVGG